MLRLFSFNLDDYGLPAGSKARWLQGTELLIETPSLLCLKVLTDHLDIHFRQSTFYLHHDLQEKPNFDQERFKQTRQTILQRI